jgi:hypothetical protein
MRQIVKSSGAVARGIVLVFMFGFFAAATAQPRSDFETVKTFQTKYKAIKEAIRAAKTVQDCAEISANIAELQTEFAADTSLLNRSLYPDKYDDMIDNARVDLRLTQDKLGLIENQVVRIADLETQVRVLSAKVDSLANENTKLLASLDVLSKAVTKNTKTIDSLNHIIGMLRQGLRARDAAIFAMVDSMFMQYDKNVQGLPEQQKGMLVRKVESRNIVGNILQAAQQNTRFLESTQLTGKDLLAMVKEQKQFSSYWKGVGPKLAAVYVAARERGKQIAAIDTAISVWGRKADSSLWAGLNQEFASKQIPVQSFGNADEFVANLGRYLDSQGGDVNAPKADRADKLRHFLDDAWNPSLNTQWLPMLVDQGIVTKDQQAQLNAKLAAWQTAVSTSHTVMYIAIIAVLALLVLIFVVMRRKKQNPPAEISKSMN